VFTHEIDLIAGEVIVGHIVVPTTASQLPAEPGFLHVIARARETAGAGFEVGNGEYHGAFEPGHARHFGDGQARTIEMVDGTLAQGGVETPGRKRQRIGPGANPAGKRSVSLCGLQLGQRRHPGRRLGPHDPGAFGSQRDSVLSDPAGHIEDAPSGSRPGAAQRRLRHALEQKLAIACRTRGDDVAHVTIEIDNSHGGRP